MPYGSQVTLSGSGFGATQGSSTVKISGISASVSSWSDAQIVATVPSGASTGSFINGSGFGATQGSSTVTFNGYTASAPSWSNTQIAATVPSGATTGAVRVTVGGVSSNTTVNYTIVAPIVSSTTALGRFSEEETTWAAAGVLRRWIERYGVPRALYTDWKNVYVRPPNAQERLRGEAVVTQFGRMCAKLGIRIIAASSPQAKGRVERAHGTHQDRLVKKLRLAGILNYEQANAYLAEHNRRYARPAMAKAGTLPLPPRPHPRTLRDLVLPDLLAIILGDKAGSK